MALGTRNPTRFRYTAIPVVKFKKHTVSNHKTYSTACVHSENASDHVLTGSAWIEVATVSDASLPRDSVWAKMSGVFTDSPENFGGQAR